MRVPHSGIGREKAIETVRLEIERSIPLQPIQLTHEGDMMLEYLREGYSVDHTRDSHELVSCVGIHAYCRGYVDRRRATKSRDALLCRSCYLRVLFPLEIKTYGELRQTLIA